MSNWKVLCRAERADMLTGLIQIERGVEARRDQDISLETNELHEF
jgi:hypothetical protein